MYPMILNTAEIGASRASIVAALEAEGVMGLAAGYANVHLLPMYQKKIAFGSKGFPWTSDVCRRDVSYAKGICPVAEELHDTSYLGFEMCMHELADEDVDLMVAAFHKVWDQRAQLS
jgi:dTDP-4-amino-4,6-dideoxygalactose transaminase